MPTGCDRLWEIDALREGRLSAKDEESFAHHVRSCAACADAMARDERLRQLAGAMAVAEPNELQLRRLRSRVLAEVATRPARPPRSVLVAVVVASLLVALSSWALVHRFAASTVVALPTPRAAASSPRREPEPAPSTLGEAPLVAPPDPKPAETGGDARRADTSSHGAAHDGRHSAVVSRTRSVLLDASISDDATDAYAAAVALFHSGDYASASLAFRAFTRMYPREPQVEDATYLDAVALARAGRTDAAGAAAEEHLARFPRSFHRREASILIARAARDRGDCAQARATLAPWLVSTADREAEATVRACTEP